MPPWFFDDILADEPDWARLLFIAPIELDGRQASSNWL
jgi:hypothetical protein